MKHGAFLIWMLAWPLVETVCDVVRYRWYRPPESVPSDDMQAIAALITIFFYGMVGYMLWTTAA